MAFRHIDLDSNVHRTYGAAEGLGRAEIVVATANLLAYVKDGPEIGRVGQCGPRFDVQSLSQKEPLPWGFRMLQKDSLLRGMLPGSLIFVY